MSLNLTVFLFIEGLMPLMHQIQLSMFLASLFAVVLTTLVLVCCTKLFKTKSEHQSSTSLNGVLSVEETDDYEEEEENAQSSDGDGGLIEPDAEDFSGDECFNERNSRYRDLEAMGMTFNEPGGGFE